MNKNKLKVECDFDGVLYSISENIIKEASKKFNVEMTENGKKVSNITLAVPRSYKNSNGEYETDFIDCVLWTGIAENTVEYCRKGDLVGLKGRVQTRVFETEDEKKRHVTEVVAEKITFLSNKKTED